MKGLVHVYCGDGKEKTITVIGSVMRAVGRGMCILIVCSLKTDDSDEVLALIHVPGIALPPCDQNSGLSRGMTLVQKQAASAYHRDNFYKAWEMAVGQDGEGGLDMLVPDEITGACNLGFVDEDLVLNSIRHKPEHMEVILTGRGSSKHMEKCSDYITEMVTRRHPFEQGIGAREGTKY